MLLLLIFNKLIISYFANLASGFRTFFMNNSIQTDFDFSKSENFFREKLKESAFYTLFEVSTPSKKHDFDSSVNSVQSINNSIMQVKDFSSGLAFTDKVDSIDSWNVAEFASAVLGDNRLNRDVIYVSGKNSSYDQISDTIARCVSSGFKNIIPVTGDGFASELPLKEQLKQHCFDSVHSLDILKRVYSDYHLFPGAVVNPFKFLPEDSYPQYVKLVKKINFGANFIVTQIGWDMMKHQELRWYLNNRDLHFPTIARIQLLTPDSVKDILDGKKPGVHISRDFRMILEKENEYGYKQFAAAQWRRLQLQVAGCRLLGYSGIQLAGLDSSEHIMTAVSKIKDALKEFSDFESWKVAYQNHLSRSDMAPFEHRFYQYKNLFTSSQPKEILINPIGITKPSFLEKIHYKICKAMFSDEHHLFHGEHILSKKIFTGCSNCSYCRLPLTNYICPETCPKGLANGPCGGSDINGDCELRSIKCIYAKWMKIATWLNEIDLLEERLVKHPEIGKK